MEDIRVVAISDVHGKWNSISIPSCDILISCGDYSFRGEPKAVIAFHEWLDKQPAKHIISVQGNHEVAVEKNFSHFKTLAQNACPRVHFIDEGLVEVEGLKIWCSAVTPWFHDWAWNAERGPEIREHWDLIPQDTDILVTHGPPHGILDRTARGHFAGCEELTSRIKEIGIKHHFFGHIHEGYGHVKKDNVDYWNVSICNENYRAVNSPVQVSVKRSSWPNVSCRNRRF